MPASLLVKSSPSPPLTRCYGAGTSEPVNGHEISLAKLLAEAELEQYEEALRTQLKIMRVEHLKDVRESDLSDIGMSKPEQRRLLKVFHKYYPPSLAKKLKQKVLHRKATTAAVVSSGTWNNACDSTTSSSSYSLRRCSSNEEMVSASAVNGSELKKAYAADDSQALDGEQHIIPASNIILCRQLGKGEFGTVWQGVWTTSSITHSSNGIRTRDHRGQAGLLAKIQVAVKQIVPEKMLTSPLDFVREAAIMHRIHHENIVIFYGVVLDTQTIMLVTELAPSRSLAECLKEERSAEQFSIIQLCEFAQQICSGMAYLEANRFIHRDLAARNILVFSAHKVKISDFGLSRALGTGEEYYRSNFTTNLKLPIAWCAPECINYLKFTTASDVWAYGVTLWEMFTYGFQPWVGMNGQQIFDTVNAPKMCRLECPDACPQEYYNLMLKCWRHEAEKRPKFNEIQSILPTIEPERVVTVKACQDGQLDHLQHGVDVVITVLNKKPAEYPDGYYWKGALKNGRTGLFLPTSTVAYLESQRPGMPATSSVSAAYYKTKTVHHQNQQSNQKSSGSFIRTAIDSLGGLTRRSSGKTGINGAYAKEKNGGTRPLISLPQNDFRHTGHLGLDGICFGDVPTHCIGLAQLKTLPKHSVTSFDRPLASSSSTPKQQQRQQRFESYSSETACLLSVDDEDTGEENGSSKLRRGENGENDSGADLDEVQPVSIVCGDSGGWLLDEVLQAIDQCSSTAGGCTNVAARFSNEDAPPERRGSSDAPISPTSALDDDDTEDDESSNDTKRLWLANSSRRRHLDGGGKANKEKTVKPLSSSDVKMLNEIDRLADKLSSKALNKERDRLQEEQRKLGLVDDFNDKRGMNRNSPERSPSPTSDSMKRHLMKTFHRSSPNSFHAPPNHRATFTDSLAMKRDGAEMKVSPEAENAYKTLIEGKVSTSNAVLLPREERDDPQRPSVEEEHEDASATEDETNPLRMLRNEGANVVRRFTRQGSGRRQQLVEKPTPPVRKKCQAKNNGGAHKAVQDDKPVQEGSTRPKVACHENGTFKSASVDQIELALETKSSRRPLPPPPPVPPRASPRLDGSRKNATRHYKSGKPVAPAIPPKPKFGNSVTERSTIKKEERSQNQLALATSSSTEEDNIKRSPVCPSFTLDDINKYDLLNFVLSGLPETKIAEERQKLQSMERADRKVPSDSVTAKRNAIRQLDRDVVPASRKEILIEDDAVHV